MIIPNYMLACMQNYASEFLMSSEWKSILDYILATQEFDNLDSLYDTFKERIEYEAYEFHREAQIADNISDKVYGD